ncbi:MAG TPA: hypothetical protein DCF33_01980 [Saprospirales bacterium]|nr:hypothetical protein [Saprospirales bacterium]
MKSVFYSFISLKHFLLLFALLGTASVAFAQANKATLSVQGVLTKSDGTAVDDGNDYKLTFRLWDDASSTDNIHKVHQELIENITVVGGVYSVVLGLDDTQPLNAAFNKTYWLGVSVGTSSIELLPRPRLTHAPYALGLVGQNNTFPSTGPVIGDAFRARGGDPIGGQGPDGNGFSFKPGGDEGGGMFSRGANNIELWAGGQERMQLNNAQNELYGQTVNFGPFISNDLTINGNQQINGSSNISLHQTVQGWHTVNGFSKINANQEVTGFSTIGANQTVNGSSFTKGFNRAASWFDNSGFTFNYTLQGGIDDTDSGLFGKQDGIVQIRSNGSVVAEFSPPQGYTNQCCNTLSAIKLYGIQKGPDNPEVEWDEQTGHLQVDNSSRRLKRNINPLTDNYRLILKAQPKLYNRIGYPDERVELGYIAEEFDSIGLTRLVHYNGSGEITGVNYKKVSIYLNEVVKDHELEIEKMKAEIAALQAENNGLKAQNSSLQTANADLSKQQNAFSGQLENLLRRIQALESSSTGK